MNLDQALAAVERSRRNSGKAIQETRFGILEAQRKAEAEKKQREVK